MNYIKKLEMEIKEKNEKIEEINQIVNELRRYLNSDKFRAEQSDLQNYVNIKDVLIRLQEI
jgi:negative regulator of replication initiation